MRSSAASVVAALLVAACSRGDDDKAPAAPPAGQTATPAPAATGLHSYAAPAPARECKVDVLKKGDGREVKKGDTVLAHFSFALADGTKTLADTRTEGDPQPLEVGDGYQIAALDQALLRMRVGDHWKIAAPYPLAWGEQGYPPMVPPRADVVLDVEVLGFLEIRTETLKEGSGSTPLPGDFVLIHETGTLASTGAKFDDTRATDAPTLLTMGVAMLRGWELALARMKVGDRWKVAVPWRYAFGAPGRPPVVPAKADVVYDIERLPLPEVKIEFLERGKGDPVVPGATATVHYVGTLKDGTKFDSSRDGHEPYRFLVGAVPHQVIAGWEIAVQRMRVGDRAKITVPWVLAYGVEGRPPSIPSKADLVFDIEVLDAR